MLKFIMIFILALLVPEIIKTYGIDHPIKTQRRVYTEVGKVDNFFRLPRGQPESRASIIQERNHPRNKGEPNSRATIINTQLTTPRNKGEPTQESS
jgi:hypothetical protein